MKHHKGMTLLEVMVAIMIFAITATAILRSGSEHLRSTAVIKEISIATWVANNQLSEIVLEQTWPLKKNKQGEEEMANQMWYWKQRIEDTMDKEFKQVTIEVATDQEMQSVVTSVSTYIAMPVKAKTK